MPDRSPLYEAQHALRYERQQLIRDYQAQYQCRLVILIDVLFPESITLFEETLHDADPSEDMHVMLSTPGGDGETAIRLIRQAQSRCKDLTVIVPDQAKSAGTLFVLGANRRKFVSAVRVIPMVRETVSASIPSSPRISDKRPCAFRRK